ncbi:MAG: hypothetical protein ACR2PU_01550, partial [Gammaproteobacteria bacterium]
MSLLSIRLAEFGFTYQYHRNYYLFILKGLGLSMSYFGESTLEHKVLKYMDGIKNANKLKDYEIV